MSRFVQFQECLLRCDDSVIDVDDALVGIIESEYLRNRGFQPVADIGRLLPQIRQNCGRIEDTACGDLDFGSTEEIVYGGWKSVPRRSTVEKMPRALFNGAALIGIKTAIVRSCHSGA